MHQVHVEILDNINVRLYKANVATDRLAHVEQVLLVSDVDRDAEVGLLALHAFQ